MELLEFIFKSGWHFVGTVVLICIVSDGIVSVVRAAVNRAPAKKDPE